MKLSLWGWKIELGRDLSEPTTSKTEIEIEEWIDKKVDLPGEVTPGYQAIERELEVEGDSVEEREWREEQNWIDKRTQRDATI